MFLLAHYNSHFKLSRFPYDIYTTILYIYFIFLVASQTFIYGSAHFQPYSTLCVVTMNKVRSKTEKYTTIARNQLEREKL